MTIEFIFAEFKSKNKIPTENVLRYFPEAKITVYNENNVESIFDKDHPRWGWRMNDYYKVKGILDSKADIAISLDADMFIVSDQVRAIIPLLERFDLCLPSNSRFLVRKDTLIGADSDQGLDETQGNAYAFNAAIIGAKTGDILARAFLKSYLNIMRTNPVRGPLALWRAVWSHGYYPCLLPPQWCVCEADLGIGDEIILHIGHEKVRQYYAGRY